VPVLPVTHPTARHRVRPLRPEPASASVAQPSLTLGAVATLATQVINQAGLQPSYAAVGGAGDKFSPGDNVFLHVKNTNAATRTVTIDSKVPSNFGTDVDLAVVIPANTGDVMIGPLQAQRFTGPDGFGDISYSATAGLTIAVVRI